MATVATRRPFAPRALQGQLPAILPLNTLKTHAATTPKRPRSPEHHETNHHPAGETAKRMKSSTATTSRDNELQEKERRRADREAAKEEFRQKYTRAFPSWVFYFDCGDAEREQLTARVTSLHARVAKFFSNEVTHFITSKPIPESDQEGNKENAPKASASAATLRSPIKLRGLPIDDVHPSGYEPLVKKARQLGMKIWETTKLSSVLDRCLAPEPTASTHQPTKSLTSLLESERRRGTTSERDPTQKRHDYRYFAKNSYFVLVEDIRQEVATIAAQEYPITRSSDGKEKGTWPVLYCHPQSRGPFVPYNEREERRREKLDRMDREREQNRAEEVKRIKMKQLMKKKSTDLRRSVSISNLHRQAQEAMQGFDEDIFDEPITATATTTIHPSGYLDSTTTGDYIAASGNSVGITSNFGTTSALGLGSSFRSNSQLPAVLRDRLQNTVVTSRRVTVGKENEDSKDKGCVSAGASASMLMPPPADIPDRKGRLLRKCKSTNTLRLPKRDEKSKPGYCESCRMKFDDFKSHVTGRKHQKFATNDANFAQLDYTLARVARKPLADVEANDFDLDMHYGGDGDGEDADGDATFVDARHDLPSESVKGLEETPDPNDNRDDIDLMQY